MLIVDINHRLLGLGEELMAEKSFDRLDVSSIRGMMPADGNRVQQSVLMCDVSKPS